MQKSRLAVLVLSAALVAASGATAAPLECDAAKRGSAWSALLEGAADHGVSEALYLRDPDGNGVELYRDRPPAEWPRSAEGELAMYTRRLDLDDLLRDTEAEAT